MTAGSTHPTRARGAGLPRRLLKGAAFTTRRRMCYRLRESLGRAAERTGHNHGATEDIRRAEYQLRVGTGSGSLAGRRLGDGPDMVGHGRPMPHLGAALAYEPLGGAP